MTIHLKSIFLFLIPFVGVSQIDTTLTDEVENITISATKIQTNKLTVPIAISTYKADAIQAIRQQLSLQEYINAVPGVFAMNANNYAQDLRISIRGFGARASFGIRGIKIIVDGVPETTPDGQGQIDNLNLSIVDRIEVIRGPASSLYGNAAGGVINIKTIDKIATPYFQLGTTFGAYGMQQYLVEGGGTYGQTTYIGQMSYNKGNGYRINSGYKNWNFNGKINHRFDDASKLTFNINYSNSPQADDPGGVNLETQAADRRAARDRNLQFSTGETITQTKTSVSYERNLTKNGKLSVYGFGANRDFLGFVPFEFGGVVDLEREYFGLGVNYTLKSFMTNGLNTVQFGVDYGSQDDTRLRYINANGIQGDLISDQNELYTALGFYALDHLSFQNWRLSAGIRYDRNAISSVSDFVGLGMANTELEYTSFNPSLGVSFSISDNTAAFANYSRSFETPSLSELFADPNGGPGLNEDLEPQIANSFELGIKGTDLKKLSYEAVLYRINTTNDLVPFEVKQMLGLIFYRNAGQTIRKGIELTGGYKINSNLQLDVSYTYSDFKYDDFNTVGGDFTENFIPGIPKHYGNIAIKSREDEGLIYQVEARIVGSLYGADDNVIRTDSYGLVNFQVGYNYLTGTTSIRPFIGVNNVMNVDYNDNVRINAFGGRHFESGPPINIFGGVKVRF